MPQSSSIKNIILPHAGPREGNSTMTSSPQNVTNAVQKSIACGGKMVDIAGPDPLVLMEIH